MPTVRAVRLDVAVLKDMDGALFGHFGARAVNFLRMTATNFTNF